MARYAAAFIRPSILAAMREWAMDCEWADGADIAEMSDSAIVRGIERHYDHGVEGFLESIGHDADGSMREPRGRVQ